MKCKDIRELLKSDYLDRESGRKEEELIKEHLSHCPECRSLEKELLSQRGVFQKAARLQPPERVWQNIREAIVSERLEDENSLTPGVLERLKDLIWYRRPVFALASALAVTVFIAVLAGGIVGRRNFLNSASNGDILSVYSVGSDNIDSMGDMGTSIEEYFL